MRKIRLPMQETQKTLAGSLGWKNPLEKEMATHSSILAWRISWTEEPCGLQSMGLQRVRQNRVTERAHSVNLHRVTLRDSAKWVSHIPEYICILFSRSFAFIRCWIYFPELYSICISVFIRGSASGNAQPKTPPCGIALNGGYWWGEVASSWRDAEKKGDWKWFLKKSSERDKGRLTLGSDLRHTKIFKYPKSW